MEDTAILSSKQLCHHYGGELIVDHISLTLFRGRITALLGPNGAGKSTLLKLLAGLMHPSAGGVALSSEPTTNAAIRIGYLPDRAPLYGELSLLEQLHHAAALYRIPRSEAGSKIDALITALQLSDQAQKLTGQLSKGYRQRLGLAQVLLPEPHILLLDEPTEGLDPAQILLLQSTLQSYAAKGNSVLISTHLLHDVALWADEFLFIKQGKLVGQESSSGLRQQQESLAACFMRLIYSADIAP